MFNLQVIGTPEYFANGVLVHNCSRYICSEMPEPVKIEADPKTPDQAFWERMRARQKEEERLAKQEEAGAGW